MIVVKVELHRFGNSKDVSNLGVMYIWNTGDHPERPKKGNYKFTFKRPNGKTHSGQVKDFPRKIKSAFTLLKLCLDSVETP